MKVIGKIIKKCNIINNNIYNNLKYTISNIMLFKFMIIIEELNNTLY